jgi:hypothetical protein
MTFKFLTVYLNNAEDVQTFEAVSGMIVARIPEFPGQAAPQRGASPSSDKFIVKVPKPLTVILHDNPKYDQAAADAATTAAPYTVPKRKFLRWEGAPAKAETTTQANGDKPALLDGKAILERTRAYEAAGVKEGWWTPGELIAHLLNEPVRLAVMEQKSPPAWSLDMTQWPQNWLKDVEAMSRKFAADRKAAKNAAPWGGDSTIHPAVQQWADLIQGDPNCEDLNAAWVKLCNDKGVPDPVFNQIWEKIVKPFQAAAELAYDDKSRTFSRKEAVRPGR